MKNIMQYMDWIVGKLKCRNYRKIENECGLSQREEKANLIDFGTSENEQGDRLK